MELEISLKSALSFKSQIQKQDNKNSVQQHVMFVDKFNLLHYLEIVNEHVAACLCLKKKLAFGVEAMYC